MEPDGISRSWLRYDKGAWFNAKQVTFSEHWDHIEFDLVDTDGKLTTSSRSFCICGNRLADF